MVWDGATNNDDLSSDIDFLAGSDDTSYPQADKVRNANRALDRCQTLIFKADGRWPYHSGSLATEILDTSLTLTSGNQKYAIPVTWLKIARIRVKDPSGNWITLKPINRSRLNDDQLAGSGTPWGYFKLGNFIYLVDIPNYTGAAGSIEVQFQAGPDYFAVGDTTRTPGFASTYHRLVSLHTALDYCVVNDLDDRAKGIREKIGAPPTEGKAGWGMEGELVEHYADRGADEQASISFHHEDYGQSALGGGGSSRNPHGF